MSGRVGGSETRERGARAKTFCVVEMLNMKEWRAVCVMFHRRSFARDAVDGSVWMDRRRRLDATRRAEGARFQSREAGTISTLQFSFNHLNASLPSKASCAWR